MNTEIGNVHCRRHIMTESQVKTVKLFIMNCSCKIMFNYVLIILFS